MKALKLLLFLFALGIGNLYAQTTTWGFDKSHTKIRFEASHMGISSVDGQFTDYEGKVVTNGDDFSTAKIDFTIQVKSIDTDNADRDGHLLSEDFFSADKYPVIKFESTNMKKVDEDEYQLSGNLTIKDVTRPVTLEVKYNGTIQDPYGKTRAGFEIEGEINRFDYNIDWNNTFTGGLVVGREIDIECQVEIVKQ